MIDRVIAKVHNSAIILVHSIKETLSALPKIIEYLIGKGYHTTVVCNVLR